MKNPRRRRAGEPERNPHSPRRCRPAIVPFGTGRAAVGDGMIKSLSVENFRCFQRFKLNNLRRLNIIVGRNAAGKTALLESIRLARSGTPTAAWSLSSLRGQPTFMHPNPTPEIFEAPWRSLFLNFDFRNVVKTAFTDVGDRTATLRIFSDPTRAVTPVFQPLQPGGVAQPWGAPSPITPVAFERVDLAAKKSTLLATVNQPHPQQQPFYQLHLEPGAELSSGGEFFQSSVQVNSQQADQ